uniref:C-C motif chemokine 19-like n=1 Tax=Semicossyphus pulcher TaxID=241346 RepID=UPI0037E92E5A
MASRIAALLLLGVVCLGFATAEVLVDCCLETTDKRVPLKIIDRHIVQEAGQGCDIGATAFITKIGKILCISHPSQEEWVRNYIKYLERNNKKNKA